MTLLVFGGQESLDFEDLLDVVVTLGGGRRKPWRFVNESDLDSMDEVRFGNLAKQQAAYTAWRPKYTALLTAFRIHGSAAAVYKAGPTGATDASTA